MVRQEKHRVIVEQVFEENDPDIAAMTAMTLALQIRGAMQVEFSDQYVWSLEGSEYVGKRKTRYGE